MAGTITSSTQVVIDSAVGPCMVQTDQVQGMDIDDFMKTTIVSQAVYLQFYNLVSTVNPQFAQNRTPVVTGDIAVGGYS
jgi:hypothetical protein